MSRHVLVIDDSVAVLKIIRHFLSAVGYRVSIASDCIYCNDVIYSGTPPDLIILDVMMPLMSGEKKLKRLKSRDKSRNIPILLISSREDSELREIVAENGAAGYLAKPFTADQLVAVVQSILPEQALNEATRLNSRYSP